MATRNKKPRLVLFSAKGKDSFKAEDQRRLLECADITFIKAAQSQDRKTFLKEIADAHFIGITPRSFPGMTTKEIRQLRTLISVSVPTTGTEWLDTKLFSTCGIPVINTPDFSTQACAEFTWGLILDWARHIGEAKMQAARFGKRHSGLLGSELNGKTLGVVGFGNIGKRVASIGQSFGMRVVGFDKNTYQYNCTVSAAASLQDLLSESHVVSLHLPLNQKTFEMFNSKVFSSFNPASLLVNTARPDLVKLSAAEKALRRGQLAHYIFDSGYWPKQKVKSAAKMAGVTVVPHISWYTRQAVENEMHCWANRLIEMIQLAW